MDCVFVLKRCFEEEEEEEEEEVQVSTKEEEEVNGLSIVNSILGSVNFRFKIPLPPPPLGTSSSESRGGAPPIRMWSESLEMMKLDRRICGGIRNRLRRLDVLLDFSFA
mmetsp:Transcript_67430/g.99970  ORF Transcript_67430/g.99970 Transcript_67430/m.99970 type:complete len:109 (-) Transcript_67430:454-780(-)